jgi:uncharacterized membrane protein
MPAETTVILGIEVPSRDPLFLAIVGAHVLVGLPCVIAGMIAMLSPKRAGRHPLAGTIYYWCLTAVFVSATALAIMRWRENYQLFALGVLSFAAATFARSAAQRRWRGWVRLHITGMGLSYIVLLTAFYVDNGKSLPLWRELPQWAFWVLPSAVGAPILLHALLRHPLARQTRQVAG